jgi:putative lipoprotein
MCYDAQPRREGADSIICKEKNPPMKWLSVAIVLLLTGLALTACGGSAEAEVTGNIILPDGETVPEGATISVQVQDTSRADAAATTIGEQTIDGDGQGSPIPFAVAYDPDEIEDNLQYSMRVRIEDEDGNLLFINDTAILVITRGNPTSGVEVPVIKV